jgi:hypothetical protein
LTISNGYSILCHNIISENNIGWKGGIRMREKEEKREKKKGKYLKPVLTKHKKLKEVTASMSPPPGLGCTKF